MSLGTAGSEVAAGKKISLRPGALAACTQRDAAGQVQFHSLGKEEQEEEEKVEEEIKGSSGRAAAGTCGGLNVQRLQNGVPIHPVQAHQVAGVGVEARDAQTESSSRQREVLALHLILHVCYLNDKAVKVPACGAPGGGEAVPRNV